MVTPDQALAVIPEGLRKPLLHEYQGIVNSFMEHRWGAAELSGGRFCEVVYTILKGHASGSYPAEPRKPGSFVDACRRLEADTGVPRSFRILIPRLLPALYEIRNNRNVGHVGGDVNPDFMDCSAVVSIAGWILAELIRVFHGVSTAEAQEVVDDLAERKLPLIWKSGNIRRILRPDLTLKNQILLLLSSSASKVAVDDLYSWTGYDKRGYFNRLLRQLHDQRQMEFYEASGEVELLPPGRAYVSELLGKLD